MINFDVFKLNVLDVFKLNVFSFDRMAARAGDDESSEDGLNQESESCPMRSSPLRTRTWVAMKPLLTMPPQLRSPATPMSIAPESHLSVLIMTLLF